MGGTHRSWVAHRSASVARWSVETSQVNKVIALTVGGTCWVARVKLGCQPQILDRPDD